MMLDRLEGNAELKSSVRLMLDSRRLTHSVLLVGEEGLGAAEAALQRISAQVNPKIVRSVLAPKFRRF